MVIGLVGGIFNDPDDFAARFAHKKPPVVKVLVTEAMATPDGEALEATVRAGWEGEEWEDPDDQSPGQAEAMNGEP